MAANTASIPGLHKGFYKGYLRLGGVPPGVKHCLTSSGVRPQMYNSMQEASEHSHCKSCQQVTYIPSLGPDILDARVDDSALQQLFVMQMLLTLPTANTWFQLGVVCAPLLGVGRPSRGFVLFLLRACTASVSAQERVPA